MISPEIGVQEPFQRLNTISNVFQGFLQTQNVKNGIYCPLFSMFFKSDKRNQFPISCSPELVMLSAVDCTDTGDRNYLLWMNCKVGPMNPV